MTRVKICGLTRPEDALQAAQLGAWALGFVFHPASPRAVDPAQAGLIVRAVRAGHHAALAVGVFVDRAPTAVAATARAAELDAVQLHGSEPPDDCRRLRDLLPGVQVIKAFRPRTSRDLDGLDRYAECDAWLVDSWDPVQAGGTGRPSDWSLARPLAERFRLILAGGLHADNVDGALEAVSPWALDLSSGVERSPGVKCATKLRRLFDRVREVTP